ANTTLPNNGETGHGVQIQEDGTQYNVVAGNFIGTNVTGTAALPNAGAGVVLAFGSDFNRVGTNCDGVADDAERNIISGNTSGVVIAGAGSVADGNVVAGNFIGTDVKGGVPVG